MTTKQAVLACLLLAVLLSNLPFLNERWFAVLQFGRRAKATAARLLEWLLLYAAWIALALALESSVGKLQPKDWTVWAVSLAFFAVLAFPGVAYRYLWHARTRA